MSDDACTVRFVTDTASGNGSKNTRLLVDGHDLTNFCRAVRLNARVDELNYISLEIFAQRGLEFDMPVASAHIEIYPLTGFRIVSETRGDRVYYWTEPEEPRVMIIPEPTPSATLTRLRELARRCGTCAASPTCGRRRRGDEWMGLLRQNQRGAHRDRSATP